MNHVFEHINNPTETLIELKRILKENGTLIMGVPNTSSVAYKIFGKNWVQLDIPRHLFDYNPEIIKNYAKKVSLKFEKLKYNSSHVQFMISILRLTNQYRKKRYIYPTKSLFGLNHFCRSI
jgi:predicted SAM-dependent methyltransferase